MNLGGMEAIAQQVAGKAILDHAKETEQKLDAKLAKLDNMDEDDLDKLREKRKAQLIAAQKIKQDNLSNGHGRYSELPDQPAFFEATKKSKWMAVHFYRPTTQRCQIVDGHLDRLAQKHIETRSSPDAVLPLELGQELTLCGLDASNQVVQGNYVPLTPRKQRGAFEVVVMKATDGAELDDGLPTTRSNREFSRFLDNLPLGDEIAVKPGRAGLVYGGANQQITDLVLVANGVGVVPMIQMVNELLPSSSSSVASASVVWLNEKAEDFALYSELEKAFFRNHRKLDVSCVVERDLFGSHLEANANVNAASPEFKIGTLAAVAGPDFFTRKVTDYLVRRGYPEDAIISL